MHTSPLLNQLPLPLTHGSTLGQEMEADLFCLHTSVSEMEKEAKKLSFLFIGPFLRNPALGCIVTHVPAPEWG